MSWSLEVTHGDITLGSGGYGIVTGSAKLVQDLRLWFLEHMGFDDLHPEFGSLLDGGVRNGKVVPSPIGEDMRLSAVLIESEIRRVVGAYQQQQINRAADDSLRYSKTTLQPSEALAKLHNIQFTQQNDTLLARLTLETVSGATTTLDIPLANR